MTGALKTSITSDSQPYVDEPVWRVISDAQPLAFAINRAFGTRRGRRIPGVPLVEAQIREVDHYERVYLRWMTPDGRGGLKPKYE